MPDDVDDLSEFTGIGPGPNPLLFKINAADFLLVGDDRINELVVVRENKVPYYVAIVPGLEIRQVNVFDPDGNKVEMQFEKTDDPDTDLSPFLMKEPEFMASDRVPA